MRNIETAEHLVVTQYHIRFDLRDPFAEFVEIHIIFLLDVAVREEFLVGIVPFAVDRAEDVRDLDAEHVQQFEHPVDVRSRRAIYDCFESVETSSVFFPEFLKIIFECFYQ